MHYSDQSVLDQNEIAVVVYLHEGDTLFEIASIQHASFISPFQMNEILYTLKHTLCAKLNEFQIIEFDRFYYVDIRITNSYTVDYEVLEFTDVTDHTNEFYKLH